MDIPNTSYDISFNDNKLIKRIKTRWMETDFTQPVELAEKFQVFIDGKEINVDIVDDDKDSTFLIRNKNCEFRREVKEHAVFPNPEIILSMKNLDKEKHELKFTWKIKSLNNYAMINEKLSEKYTNYKQYYLFFMKIPDFYNRETIDESTFVLEASIDEGQDELHVIMFFSRNFMDPLGFSGIGFLIDKSDKEGATGAVCANIFGSIESDNNSFPIQSLYSPIFWTDKGNIPNFSTTLNLIQKSSIKKLIFYSDIIKEFKEKLEEIGIEFVKIDKNYNNKTLDLQCTIDNLMNRKTYFDIIFVVPENFLFNLNFASYMGRLGFIFLIHNSETIKILNKIKIKNEIIILGTEQEIPAKFDEKLEKNFEDIPITRIDSPLYERNMMFLHIFLSKYIVHKLILREYIDPDDEEWEFFLEKLNMEADEVINKYVKGKEFLDYDQIVLAEPPVNGPQNSILATLNEDMNGWQNAVIGANYAKSKNVLCFIVYDYSRDDKRHLASLLKQIDKELDNYKKLIELSLEIGEILDENIPIFATSISAYLTLFPSDASVPFELIFRPGRFGIESIGTKFCIGRIIGDDIYDTSLLATSSIIFSLTPHGMKKTLLVGNPTGDLDFSQMEAAFLAGILDIYGFQYTFLGTPISDQLLKEINERYLKFGYEIAASKIQPVDKPYKSLFIKELTQANIVHYSGHGGIEGGPHLVLADCEGFFLSDIPLELKNNPFIFANACLAGLSINYEKNISLASKFIESGAIGYIGALWRVSDASSLMLGLLFYDFLLYSPVGAVLRQLKESLIGMVPNDYTSLAFILYGDPTIHYIDPFYKAIESIYYFKNLTECINSAQDKKAEQYFERTIRAFKLFKRELEERIKKRPEYEKIYNLLIINLEGRLKFLTGTFRVIKTLNKNSDAFMSGEWEKLEDISSELNVSSKDVGDASDIAWDPGSKFTYKLISNHQKEFSYLLLTLFEYSNKNYRKALEYLNKGNEFILDSKERFDVQIHSKDPGLAPFQFLENQINIMELLIEGWRDYILGEQEYDESKDAIKITTFYNSASQKFLKVVNMNDMIMSGIAEAFLRFLIYDYALHFFNLKRFGDATNLFNFLKERCEVSMQILNSAIEEIRLELPQELSRIEKTRQFILSLQHVAIAFLHLLEYSDSKKINDKENAIKMFEQAINITPTTKYKEEWKGYLEKIK